MMCSECCKDGADRIYKWATVNVISFVCRECEALVREQDATNHETKEVTTSLPPSSIV